MDLRGAPIRSSPLWYKTFYIKQGLCGLYTQELLPRALSIATLSIMTFSITTFSITTLSITTFSTMTLSIIENKMPHSA